MQEQVKIKLIEKFDVDKLIKDHIERTGTDESFWIVDVGDVIRKYILWYDLMPRIDPDFAIKSCNHISIAGTLAALGAGYDCASPGEIEKVLEMGVGPEKIVFAQTVKPVSHIKFAKEKNARLMTFDNEEELYKLKKHFPGAELLLRLRFDPKVEIKLIGFGEKYGCMPGEKSEFLLRKARELNLNVKGVAFHIGVGCVDFDIFGKAIEDSAAAFEYGNSIGLKMNLLDIGGGFPGRETETITGVSKVINESLAKYFPDVNKVKVISEPGTFFCEKGFTLAVNAHSKRVVENESGEEVHYYVTDSIHQSFNFSSRHETTPEVRPLDNNMKPLKKSVIWGRTCDPNDVVAREVFLPELETGDWLVFENSGAYQTTTSTTFNGFTDHPIYAFIEKKMWETLKKLKLPNIKLPYEVVE